MRGEESMLIPDEGFYFGVGAFETIAVEEGRLIFLQQHYERLQRAMDFFGIKTPMEKITQKVAQTLAPARMHTGRKVLKITVSPENLLVTARENVYGRSDYERGFRTDFSEVRRNETSPFTFHKTLNYGDCLLEKRRAKDRGIDEPVFLNMKGEIAEGASTNVFFVRQGQVLTPPVSSGLLPGILRGYICDVCGAREQAITPEEAAECEEMFLTNSLLGVMPVVSLGAHRFVSQSKSRELLEQYQRQIQLFAEIGMPI